MSSDKNVMRLFFAIWPDKKAQRVLAENAWHFAESTHGRTVPTENLHMTLLFLGDQPKELLPEILVAASKVRAPSFEVVCDKIRYMDDHQLVWSGVTAADPALEELRLSLAEEMKYAEITYDKKRFKPHVTLTRKSLTAPTSVDFVPTRWKVGGFSLVASNLEPEGPRYQILKNWSLLPPKPRTSDKIIKLAATALF